MLHFMLDTDTSSYIMNRSSLGAMRRLQSEAVGDVCISAISRSELEYGVEVSPRRDKDRRSLDIFLRHIEVLDFPSDAALDYAQIRAFLKVRGRLIGANDLLIAAHARFLELTLVTNNTREYLRVPGLKVENWA
ncbi:MAG: PIN domain-containing protein [Candidatus Korobacteraceae bacterium]|jgi:tRNA(fMet)-specific endonuclease VapC